jgi:hypothetical protein
MTRFVFITGGVVSSLGKGLASAAIGALLQARGYSVRLRKLDPYLNVDPGTMSPYQHGKRMVLDTCSRLGLAPTAAIAVGDGANDLPMMSVAGLSVAYHAKPRVRALANVAILSGGLDRLLEVLRD